MLTKYLELHFRLPLAETYNQLGKPQILLLMSGTFQKPPGVMCVLDDVCATMHAVSEGADTKFVEVTKTFSTFI